MKKFSLFVKVLLLTTMSGFSQGAAINTTGTSANPSAILDISSTNAGILIPRMTETQKNSILSPATGLMIYQTDGITGFWHYNGTLWVQAIGPMGPTGSDGATGATGPAGTTGLLAPGFTAGNTPYWDGTQWILNSSNIFNNGGSVGIGVSNPASSAKLDISSNTGGLLIPRMTTVERNAIPSPVIGLMVFNTDCENIDIYISNGWQQLNQSGLTPSIPIAGTHIPSETEIIWNWNTVSGATGYKYNTINNYASATDNGGITSYTQTALTCNTTYTLYVWSYSPCGNSSANTLTQTTSACFVCGNNLTFSYHGSSVTYGSVLKNGICWLDRNLGATAVATAYNHFDGYGDLFQWGRLDDGHQLRTSGITSTQSSSVNPGHSYYITSFPNWYSGTSPNPNDLWQGASGINNPCPNGWRIPTETELNTELLTWSPLNYVGAFASTLKWTAAGDRNYGNGTVYNEGSYGFYWSSTVSGTDARGSLSYNSSAYMYTDGRSTGLSVRCLRDY